MSKQDNPTHPAELPESLRETCEKLANEYRDEDFKNNPNGYTVAPYVNEYTTSTAFDSGFTACYQALLPRINELEREVAELKHGENFDAAMASETWGTGE